MANAGPVDLNRSLSGAPEYPPAVPAAQGTGGPVPARTGPFSRAVDFTRCDTSIPDSGTLPLGDNGYRLINWFRRRFANTSGDGYGVKLAPPSWTLDHPPGAGGDKPSAPIPRSTRQWDWTLRRTFGVDRGRYPTHRHSGHDSYPRDRSGRRAQPRMRGGYSNLLTTWKTPGSFGQLTESASQANATPDTVGSGPYG